jgi:hypothetical protein
MCQNSQHSCIVCSAVLSVTAVKLVQVYAHVTALGDRSYLLMLCCLVFFKYACVDMHSRRISPKREAVESM